MKNSASLPLPSSPRFRACAARLLAALRHGCRIAPLGLIANAAFGQTTITFTDGQIDATAYDTGSSGLILTIESGSATQSGILSGTGGVTKTAAGTLVLSADNTFTGGTTISAGSLQIGDGGTTGSLASASTVTVASGASLRFNRSDTLTHSGVIDGAGSVVFNATGTIRLSGANTYAGGTVLNSGTLALGGSSVIGTGRLTINGGAIRASGAARTVTNAITINGAFTLGRSTTLSGPITLNNNITITSANPDSAAATTSTLNGVISGAYGLTFDEGSNPTGSLLLSGANTYTGATTINGGTIFISNDSRLGAAPSTATAGHLTLNGGTLAVTPTITLNANRGIALGSSGGTLNASGTLTYNGIIAGGGSLIKSGTGTLVLGGVNTYTGGTTLAAGTLTVNSGATLSSNTTPAPLTVNAGTLNLNNTAQSVSTLSGSGGTISLGAGHTFTVDQSIATSFAGALTGTGTLTKSGAGTLTLSGVNTYSGGSLISAGTLQIGGGGSTGGISGDVVNNASLVFNRSNALAYAGIVSGSGSLTQAGTGTLTLSGANTYSGGTTVSAGTLALSGSGTLGADTNALTLTGGTLDLGGLSRSASAVTFAGGSLTNGTLTGASYDAQSGTVDAILAGSGALTKTTAGTLTLSGANTYSGGTTVSAGTLALSGSGTLGADTNALTLTGGTLDLGGLSRSASAVTFAGGSLTNGTLTGASYDAQSGTVGAILAGSGALTKTTAGTLTLSGANTYSGATTLAGGVLAISSQAALGPGAVTFNGGTLATTGDISFYRPSAPTTLAAAGGTLDVATNGFLLWGSPLSGSGSLTKQGEGELALVVANTHSGGVTLAAGRLSLWDANSLGTGTFTIQGGTASIGDAVVRIANATMLDGNFTVGGGLDFAGPITLNRDLTLQTDLTGGNAIFSGVVSGAHGLTFSGPALSSTLFSAIVLSGANTYTGPTTIASGTVRFDNPSALGQSAITVASGATAAFNFGGAGEFTSLPTSSVNFSPGARLGVFTTNATDGVATLTQSLSGDVSLVKGGSGTLVVTGDNTYTGGTTLGFGTLELGSAGALGSAGTISFDGSGTLRWSSANTTDYSSRFSNASGQLFSFDTNGQNVTLASDFDSDGSPIEKYGAGTLTLSGGSSVLDSISAYAGTTVLDGGLWEPGYVSGGYLVASSFDSSTTATLRLANGATVSAARTVVSYAPNSAGVLTVSDAGSTLATDELLVGDGSQYHSTGNSEVNILDGGHVSGGAVVVGWDSDNNRATVSGSGSSLIVTHSDNTWMAPNLWVGAGRGSHNSLDILAGATVSIAGDTLLEGGYNRLTVSGAGSSLSTAGIYLGLSNDFGMAGDFGNTVTIQAGGTLSADVVQSNSGWGGASTVNIGAPDLAHATTAGSFSVSHLVFQSGADTLNFNQTDAATFATSVTGPGKLVQRGAGTTTLTGDNTGFTGAIVVTAGTLALGSTGALGNSGTISFTGGTLQFTAGNTTDYSARFSSAAGQSYQIDTNGQNLTFANALTSSGGSFTKLGAGTLTLSAANTYSGGTTVSAGTLVAGNASAFGTGTVRVEAGTLELGGLSLANDIVNQGTLAGSSGPGATTTLTGHVTGAGHFQGNFILQGSYSPGNSPAAITFTGDTVFGPGHVLTMEIGGTTAGSGYDTITVTGMLSLGGTLTVVFINGFVPAPSDTFQFFTASSIGGSFAQVNLPAGYSAVGNSAAGDGFSLSAIPEPSAWSALAGLGALAAAGRRRRRRA